ncbi:MAG: selenocysteine-specific translation elongation factor [Oscillospiraceae bacterium]|nr:selenocysteine-specific translation elongation factor [Oscillospiraceae bacterium]
MKHIIIGTAGHVDHGKTTLVKALTGIDTDRLEEEKRRGVTIEPGFAYLDFDDGTRAGIIDVPGHERFIRNMLAGSGGVDLAMLIIAADEGIMPQTREHLDILTLLGITDGLVAVTKTDKVDSEWLELVYEDIAGLMKNTFLENKPVVSVSAKTGEGIAELKNALFETITGIAEKNIKLPFRLPVDRAFPVDGFGTVVTGTLIEGSVSVGDIAEILPSGQKATIRSLQAHGKDAETVYAGQRTAISLSSVKRGNIKRGDVVAADGMVNVTSAIDVKISIISGSGRVVKNGDRLHFYHGAETMPVKVFLLDKTKIQAGESCYARLKLTQPLACKRCDRFVIRFLSPLETIGGGIILASLPDNRINRSCASIEALKIRETGNAQEIILQTISGSGGIFTLKELCKQTDLDSLTCSKVTLTLTEQKQIICLLQGKYVSTKWLKTIGEKSKQIINDFHLSNPLRSGMSIAELRQKLLPSTETTEANAVLKELERLHIIKLSEREAALPEFSATYSPVQDKIREKIIADMTSAGYDVKTPEELAALFPKNEKRDFEQVFESLVSGGELIKLTPSVFWHKEVYNTAVALIKAHFEKSETITLAECRDMLKTSRKYALAFLEHLDGKQVTHMQGDARKLSKGFAVL